MAIHKDLIEKIIAEKTKIISIIIQGNTFPVESSEISYTDVPVNSPTMRGGVYFSDTRAYRAKILVNDYSISKLLSQAMLGPNTEFAKIQLVPDSALLQIFANLINYVQKSTGFELNLILVEMLAK
jgi:hypothetical protein